MAGSRGPATAAIPDEETIDPERQRRTIYETFVARPFLDGDIVGPISGHRSYGW
jgi:hypothetical protein